MKDYQEGQKVKKIGCFYVIFLIKSKHIAIFLTFYSGGVAQLVEQRPFKPLVLGSSPSTFISL